MFHMERRSRNTLIIIIIIIITKQLSSEVNLSTERHSAVAVRGHFETLRQQLTSLSPAKNKRHLTRWTSFERATNVLF